MFGLSIDQVLMVAAFIGCLLAVAAWWWRKNFTLATFGLLAPFTIAVLATTQLPDVPIQKRVEVVIEEEAPVTKESVQAVPMGLKDFDAYRPSNQTTAGFVTSSACLECHADQYHSWHASYHRTMTQEATREAVIGNFDDQIVSSQDREYSLSREGDVCWVKMHDPDFPVDPSTEIDVPVVMTTGSHHMQVYWYPSGHARTLGQLPIVYLKETDQWIPRNAAFLRPEGEVSSERGRWNAVCSTCHATHRRTRKIRPGVFDTQVAEFGISCESCHGPGDAHVKLHRQPDAVVEDDPIVNPKDLSHEASSQVCGQCHSVQSSREPAAKVNAYGHGFRPGDDLQKTHAVWERDSQEVKDFIESREFPEGKEHALRSVFWDDGMVRVAGREYNGLVQSACYQRGEMSCFSCHSLHQAADDKRSTADWANDQLSPDGLGGDACIKCHSGDQYGTNHTHHAVGSSGASCFNCHMPHTTYGLLKAIRSHTISNPDVTDDMKAGRPNACNLCHLDKTLAWTSQHLENWYGSEPAELTPEQSSVAASVLWLLKGDAGKRALAVWSMGWSDAQEVSGRDWIGPLVAQTLNDPYNAVRFIARRSLRSLEEFSDFEFDAIADESERQSRIQAALKLWAASRDGNFTENEELLIGPAGSQIDRVESLMRERDNTRINLVE